jgi:hypothetical protein
MEKPANMAVRIVGFSLAVPGWLGMWIAALLTHSYFHGDYARLALISLPFNFFLYTFARYEITRSRNV